jgi:hypothetical protein
MWTVAKLNVTVELDPQNRGFSASYVAALFLIYGGSLSAIRKR